MIHLEKSKDKPRYAEIFQQVDIRFSFANREEEVVKEIFRPVLCRDFLGDVLHAEATGTEYAIYGFSYNPTEHSIDRDKTRMLVVFPRQSLKQTFVENLEVLNSIERANNLELTIIEETDDPEYLLVEGDKYWLSAVWTISMYSFLLRAASYKYKDVENWVKELMEHQTNEGNYMRTLQKVWDKLSTSLTKFKFDPTNLSGHESQENSKVHNFSGVVTLFGSTAYRDNNVYRKQFETL